MDRRTDRRTGGPRARPLLGVGGLALLVALGAVLSGCRTTERTIAQDFYFGDGNREPLPTEERSPTVQERIGELQEAVADDPTDPGQHYLLGRLYERTDQLAMAQVSFRRLIELVGEGEDPAPHYWLGRVLARRGDLRQAEDQLLRAVSVPQEDPNGYLVNPHYREAYYLLGTIYRLRDQEEAMLDSFAYFLRYGGDQERIVAHLPTLRRRGQLR